MEHRPIRSQILGVNVGLVCFTIVLTLLGALFLTLRGDEESRDNNLMNSALLLSETPLVIEDLSESTPSTALWNFLDGIIEEVHDIDVIAIADTNNIQHYYPDRSEVGNPYAGTVQQRIFDGEAAFTSDDTGISGAERCAYAPVHSADGTLLGFVMVGIYLRSVNEQIVDTALSFLLIAALTLSVGAFLSFKLADRLKGLMMGYEPAALSDILYQREEVLEALEEGIVAVNKEGIITYANEAACKLQGEEKVALLGQPVGREGPLSAVWQAISTKRTAKNIPLSFPQNERILSDHIPMWEDGRVVGAISIWRNRTELTRLGEDLTGVRHMVEAMRAYTHEFMNKLHVVLGFLQVGDTSEAESYLMSVTSIHSKAVGLIMKTIAEPSVAALLLGKTSRCAELGIRLSLAKGSVLSKENSPLPPDACITILGNLIENAIDALNQANSETKEITVTVREEEPGLILCVEDTGPGITQEVLPHIFRQGFSTKSHDRGTGLALVQSTVEAFDGDVEVHSELGLGASFLLSFRRSPKEDI